MGREQLQNSRSSIAIYPSHSNTLLHSKSSGNMQQQLQMAAARHAVQMAANMNAGGPRTIMVSHPLQLGPIGVVQSPQMPLVNSAGGNLLHVSRDRQHDVFFSFKKIKIFFRFTSLLRG